MFIINIWVRSFTSNIWEVIYKKHEGGVCEVLNFVCWPISSCREKKWKIAILTEPPFMGQISAKYLFKLYCQKIFAVNSKSYIQLVLKVSFTSFLQPAWIKTDSFVNPSSAVGCVQLVPEYISKVKLDRRQSSNISSEIIEVHENGAWGKHLFKFLYYHLSPELNP